MTRAEVIAMARGVGIWCTLTDVACAIDALERFAALVAASEREACAVLVESEWSTDSEKTYGDELASFIRAKGAA